MPGDWPFFYNAAQVLTGRTGTSPLGVYIASPSTWIGPPALILAVPVAMLPDAVRGWTAVTVLGACLPLLCYVLERARRAGGPPDPMTSLTVLSGGAFAAIYWWRIAAEFSHPEDVLALGVAFLVLCWSRTRDGQWIPWLSAGLLGLAAAGKPWAVGLLPLAVLWSAPVLVRCLRVATAAFVAAACWAPFLLGAPGTLSALAAARLDVWWISPLALLGLGGDPFPGWVRPLQFVLVLTLGSLAVLRGQPHLVPFATVAGRVALDPQAWNYYFATVTVACLAVDVLRRSNRGPWLTMVTVFVLYDARWLSNAWWVVAALQTVPLLVLLVLLTGWRPRVGRQVAYRIRTS
ncbi:hypothetical protein OG218_24945 [Kineococcus sp. NBC_00420]|uniref:hypothetical protein n=1 Tax=Kineococcus sp. NBC_00420 TaxID=2903564 RepID=UPI002E21315B